MEPQKMTRLKYSYLVSRFERLTRERRLAEIRHDWVTLGKLDVERDRIMAEINNADIEPETI